jgi:hypothetical protein
MTVQTTLPSIGYDRSGTVRQTIWHILATWIAAAAFVPSLILLVIAVILGARWADLVLAGAAAAAAGGLVSTFATRELARLLSRPAEALVAIGRLEGDAEPALKSAAAFDAEMSRLEQRALRAVQEKQSRLKELQRVRDAAQAESQSRVEFFSGISHELRTPLNAIVGYAMLLAEDMTEKGDQSAARDLDRILIASRRLLRMINDILDLSRLDAGVISVERKAVDIKAALDRIIAESGPGGGVLKISIASGISVMLGDDAKLRQALLCLVGSVVLDHSSNISLEVTPEHGTNTDIRFTVRGTNLSLDPLRAELRRSAHTAPAAITGNGLAASVACRLASLLGGRVIVPDIEEHSAALILPRNGRADEQETLPLPHIAAIFSREGLKRRSRTVLVVDDDEPSSDLLDRWLTGKGYVVLSAKTGAEGLAAARREHPDAIILDIFMPGQSGYEVLADLRADPVLNATPVIIVSSDHNRELGLKAGASEVMVKPLSRERLVRVLEVLGAPTRGDILVVDDEPDAAEIMQRYARMAGLNVRLASSVNEGLQAARAKRPDVIVLDLCMPGADGFAMLDELANDNELGNVPVMVLSQLDISPEQHQRISKAGHFFHAKWSTSPLQIIENLKSLVSNS